MGTIPYYRSFLSSDRPYRSINRHWGGRILIWRGGSAHEYRATLASYRRVRRLLKGA